MQIKLGEAIGWLAKTDALLKEGLRAILIHVGPRTRETAELSITLACGCTVVLCASQAAGGLISEVWPRVCRGHQENPQPWSGKLCQ